MKMLLLLSMSIALVAIPLRAARISSPHRALRTMALWLAVSSVTYLVALRILYPRLL
ncbi:MAG: hypothetical protein ACOC0J_01555 [Myxococcota bacterium]